eukprot:scaffold32534_cov33-Prasinocladus_malaysianus.AAC.1
MFAYLQQCGDGQSCDAPVLVANEALHVNVAVCDGHRVCHSHLVQGADSSKAEDWLGAAEE